MIRKWEKEFERKQENKGMNNDSHVMFDVNPKIGTEACYREWDDDPENPGWFCVNDHTGCMYNDGHNTCYHEGEDESPLGEEMVDST